MAYLSKYLSFHYNQLDDLFARIFMNPNVGRKKKPIIHQTCFLAVVNASLDGLWSRVSDGRYEVDPCALLESRARTESVWCRLCRFGVY